MSSGFSASWLDRREPADVRARSRRLAQKIAAALPTERTPRALDLGAGTGSNVRFWTPLLPPRVEWLLADHDQVLLRHARERIGPHAVTRPLDLSRLGAALDIFERRDLVTASALLDLVSVDWLRQMLKAATGARAAMLFALSYDGRMICNPPDVDDERVRDLVNQHQRTDKGFGPALGPTATDVTARLLEGFGYQVWRERSDWVLKSDERELQRDVIIGWSDAAIEWAPPQRGRIEDWCARRLVHLERRASTLTVGHEDLAALPRTDR